MVVVRAKVLVDEDAVPKLAGSTQLSSGRFVMIDDGLGFSLVPWRPALEQHIGRHISGVVMPGGSIEWTLGRSRGLGL